MPVIRRSNIFDFFDPFQGFGFPYFGGAISQRPGYGEVPVFADVRMDLKVAPEADRFKADLPAFKKGGGHRQVGGRSKMEQEEKTETCYANVDQVKAPSRKR